MHPLNTEGESGQVPVCERMGELRRSVLIKSRFTGFENGTGP